MSNQTLGQKLRRLREDQGLLLRKVAAILDIDVAVLSKMERGERRLSKDAVLKLSKLYKADADELLTLYLTEKILGEIENEELAIKALHLAEKQIKYQKLNLKT
ncbi:MAG: XRE family transcriptional regulator [Bacteroidetes bacterium]|nr:MAG: XRE family transcriptional regulator [Bacteroidota bacterium]REK05203.1 MAG: XRE family transcriptional regulator [Bacteroidota bacterium]REK32608.1 MAG: XRE family transcriptional regulator [Bacteroidota bacterium]REK48945.1 MAG: XRE family transcriptional regulator [Bacteroidota bacterium]